MRGETDTGIYDKVKSIPNSGFNWNEVMMKAQLNAGIPLLYHKLKGIGGSIPQSVLQTLKAGYYLNAFRNEHLYHELGNILKVLKEDGIEPIVLKGAALTATVYQDKALRFFHDIDLLIRKRDLARAGEKLLEIGYKQNIQLSIEKQCKIQKHLVPFEGPDKEILELHWNISNFIHGYTIDIEGFWKRARPCTIAGVEALILCPEDLILHQCLHTAAHIFSGGLKHLYDISQTLWYYHDEIDWEQVTLRTHEWKSEKCVYLTLRLAEEVLQVTIPPAVLEDLKPDNFDPQIIDLAIEQLFSNAVPRPNIIARLWVAPHMKAKIAIFQQGLFTSLRAVSGIYDLDLSSKKALLYYPLYLKSNIFLYIKTAWRLLSNKEELMNYKTSHNQNKKSDILRNWFISPEV
ncbi:MAG: nucleotidyltransferase family protein [bacterium]